MKSKLIFVRHGEARGNIERVFHGFTNSDLTDNGRAQAERASKRLEKEEIDLFYASDLKRAYETALIVAKPHNGTVHTDERFREINGGRWENVPWDDLPLLFPESYKHWLYTPYCLQMPDGESMKGFQQRLVSAVEELVHQHPGKTICIATHGTAIRVLSCFFQGKSLEELTDVNWCDNAALTVVIRENNAYSLLVDGDNSHLADISTIGRQEWWKKEQQRRIKK